MYQAPRASLSALPDSLLFLIAGHLSPRELNTLTTASHTLKQELNNDALWKKLLESFFNGLASYDARLGYQQNFIANYREYIAAEARGPIDAIEFKRFTDAAKNNRYIAIKAVNDSGFALTYTSLALRDDKAFMFAAVKLQGQALKYASDRLKADPSIVRAAIEFQGYALQYASARLKNNRDIVLAAVTQCGQALQHASAELQNNRDIVKAAVKQNVNVFEYASDALKNCELMQAMVQELRDNARALPPAQSANRQRRLSRRLSFFGGQELPETLRINAADALSSPSP